MNKGPPSKDMHIWEPRIQNPRGGVSSDKPKAAANEPQPHQVEIETARPYSLYHYWLTKETPLQLREPTANEPHLQQAETRHNTSGNGKFPDYRSIDETDFQLRSYRKPSAETSKASTTPSDDSTDKPRNNNRHASTSRRGASYTNKENGFFLWL